VDFVKVREETGFDISSRLNKRQFIEIHAGLQRVKLFIIKNVPENTKFTPFAKKGKFKISQISTILYLTGNWGFSLAFSF